MVESVQHHTDLNIEDRAPFTSSRNLTTRTSDESSSKIMATNLICGTPILPNKRTTCWFVNRPSVYSCHHSVTSLIGSKTRANQLDRHLPVPLLCFSVYYHHEFLKNSSKHSEEANPAG